jgi:hypothetical protein
MNTPSPTPSTPSLVAVLSSALFAKCVEYKLMKDGMVEIHCKNGLWSVAGRDRKQVEREAAHYWQQYYADGEYNSILANAEVSDGV